MIKVSIASLLTHPTATLFLPLLGTPSWEQRRRGRCLALTDGGATWTRVSADGLDRVTNQAQRTDIVLHPAKSFTVMPL